MPGSLVGDQLGRADPRRHVSLNQAFGLTVVLVAAAVMLAVLAHRLTSRFRVASAGLFLVFAAAVGRVFPSLHTAPGANLQRAVSIALVVILFDGGMSLGWARLRTAARPVAATGIVGTILVTVLCAVLTHLAFGFDWFASTLLATAVAPTDPAVVFSVLGGGAIRGQAGAILEGEAGANDPVGIALMSSVVAAGALTGATVAHIAGQLGMQLGIGLGIGIAGGLALRWLDLNVDLPAQPLYPLRSLAAAFLLYGLATVAHGSGFLAVFVAGITVGGDPHEVKEFHATLADLGELVAFALLGLSVSVPLLSRLDVWGPGLIIAAVLTLIIRPAVTGVLLLPEQLPKRETAFVMFAGLKGAVPILLGTFIFSAGVPDPQRLYGIVFVVVAVSVLVQANLAPTVARLLGLEMGRLSDPAAG